MAEAEASSACTHYTSDADGPVKQHAVWAQPRTADRTRSKPWAEWVEHSVSVRQVQLAVPARQEQEVYRELRYKLARLARNCTLFEGRQTQAYSCTERAYGMRYGQFAWMRHSWALRTWHNDRMGLSGPVVRRSVHCSGLGQNRIMSSFPVAE